MNVWKKQTVQYLKNGKRVTKNTKGSKPKTILSKRFYGTLKTSSGKRKQVPLTEDEKTSKRLLAKLQSDEDRRRILGVSADDENEKQLEPLIVQYIEFLTMKGNISQYVKAVGQHLRKLFKQAKMKSVSDLDSGSVLKVISKWYIGLETKNHYIRDLKGFTKWMMRERKTKDDPFIGLKCFNAKTDRRRVRRAFTDDELSRLLKDTQTCGKRYLGSDWQFLPIDRVMLYRIAANTGLRAKEISTLTVSDFNLEKRTVTVGASNTKNRKQAVLPLSPTFCVTLSEFFQCLKTERLFPGCWMNQRMAVKMLKRDLKRCEIEREDTQGRVLDFHSLRYTYISNLAKGKVHPSQAQKLARHSDINLTMSVYTDLSVDDLRDAINTLPNV